jgi:hypothetical protein
MGLEPAAGVDSVGHMQALSRALVGGALAATVVVVAACGGGGDEKPPATPQGFTRSETKYFSFAHPRAWSVDVRRPEQQRNPGELVAETIGPAGTAGQRPDVVVGATPDYRSGIDGLVQVNELSARTQFAQRKVISRKATNVAGAKAARLIEAEVPAKDGTPVRTFDLLSISDKRTAVSMFIAVPAADVTRARVREILGSLQVRA